MSTVIPPTIGRIVLYFRSATEAGEVGFQPSPGIVCFVQSDSLINIAVFDCNGESGGRVDVPLLQSEQEAPSEGPFATWMQYQIDQQAKENEKAAAPAAELAYKVRADTIESKPL